MLSKLKGYLSKSKESRIGLKLKKEETYKIGLSSKYYTNKRLRELSDKAYSTIIPYYDNNYINIVLFRYTPSFESVLVHVYFNDQGKSNRLRDIDAERVSISRRREKNRRAYKFSFTVKDLNKHQGFDNLIESVYKDYVEDKKKEQERLRKYQEESRKELGKFI